jgi:fatty-acyl-CoA synthase
MPLSEGANSNAHGKSVRTFERTYKPGEPHKYQLLLKHVLEPALRYSPEKEIVHPDTGTRLNYRALNERIQRLASGLTRLGVKPGDTVSVLDIDSHRYLESFFAIPMMAATLHTVNWRLSEKQVLYTLNHATPHLIMSNARFLPLLDKIWNKLENPRTPVVAMTDDGSIPETKVPLQGREYERLLQSASPHYRFPEFHEDTTATTFYTTGTTGEPKGISFSHRELMLHTLGITIYEAYEGIGRFRSNDVYMPLTPMFHVHAWGMPYVATFLGTKQVYPGVYEPEKLLRLLQDERVTYTHCVPSILQMLMASPGYEKADLSNLKMAIGGAPLTKDLAEAASAKGIEIFVGYGLSETCPLLTASVPHEPDRMEKRIMAGRPTPLVKVRVVDAYGKVLDHDGISRGEVIARAPWATKGYVKDSKRTKELWCDGWLHTGDLGTIDKEGFLRIIDRKKDAIKSGGEWIASGHLESLLSEHEAVAECAAIAVPDEKWGERPAMVVTLKPGANVTPEKLWKFMRGLAEKGELAKYQVPDRFEIVESLPRTSVGKIDKKALRERYADD